MQIPTEPPLGSMPRPLRLIETVAGGGADALAPEVPYPAVIRDTLARFEETGAECMLEGDR